MKSIIGIVCALISAASYGLPTVTYTLTTVGEGSAWRINENGQVVGWSNVSRKAYIYTPGLGRTLIDTVPGAVLDVAYGINASGSIVGYTGLPNDAGSQPFTFSSNAGYRPLQLPIGLTPSEGPRAFAINDADSIAGENWYSTTATGAQFTPPWTYVIAVNNSNVFAGARYNSATQRLEATLWSPNLGHLNIGPIGVDGRSIFWDINSSGMAVGYGENALLRGQAVLFREQALLYDGSSIIDIGANFVDGSFSQAYGISDSGLVVGRFVPGANEGSGPMYAFAYSKQTGVYDLNLALAPGEGDGWVLVSAQDATADGRIVGWGYLDGTMSAYVLTPVSAVPEASGIVKFTLGLIILGIYYLRLVNRSSVRSETIV